MHTHFKDGKAEAQNGEVLSQCLVFQSCLTLSNPMDCSPPGSSIHGISRQEYWSGLPFPPPGDLPNPGIKLTCPALSIFTTEPPGKPNIMQKINKSGPETRSLICRLVFFLNFVGYFLVTSHYSQFNYPSTR